MKLLESKSDLFEIEKRKMPLSAPAVAKQAAEFYQVTGTEVKILIIIIIITTILTVIIIVV